MSFFRTTSQWIVKLLCLGILGYQKISRAVLPRTCRFYPSCSSYAQDALRKYGIFRGMVKAASRILRCSPLSRGGYDPLR